MSCSRPAPDADSQQIASPAAAVAAVSALVRRVEAVRVPLAGSAGRVLAEVVRADRPSPAVDVSAMDGFALRCAETTDRALEVHGEVRIGREPAPLKPGTAMRIVTGGAIPPDADAVVPIEDVTQHDGAILVAPAGRASLHPGLHIRHRGENIGTGEVVAEAGRVIGPGLATALASFGVANPAVFRRVRVSILSTGDEVVDACDTPTPWQLRDGNGPALAAMISVHPWLELAQRERLADDPDLLRDAVRRALAESDAVLLSGGVSMGHRDFVPACLNELGVRTVFHRLPQRPGRPVLGGVGREDQLVMGLPGNPLSVLVSARRIFVPVLGAMAGVQPWPSPPLVTVDGASGDGVDLWWHRLVRLTGPSRVEVIGGRGSGDVAAAARSEGFVEFPPGGTGAGPWPFYSWNG
jgi:molybdopterin molybdotransferase